MQAASLAPISHTLEGSDKGKMGLDGIQNAACTVWHFRRRKVGRYVPNSKNQPALDIKPILASTAYTFLPLLTGAGAASN